MQITTLAMLVTMKTEMEKPEPIITEIPCEETSAETDAAVVNVYLHTSNTRDSVKSVSTKETIATNIFDLGIDFNFHSYMDYRTITDKSSAQYKLQQECWTDMMGLRRHGSDYVVALGTYFTENVGDRFTVYLDNGNHFNVIVGDIKADTHTDDTNSYVPMDNDTGNMVEFIIDEYAANTNMLMLGTVSYHDFFNGSVINIERIDDYGK